MVEASRPPLRGRRRRGQPSRPDGRARAIAIGLSACAGVMTGVYVARPPEPVDPVAALATGRAALAAGDYNAARSDAQGALGADPGSVAARLLLAHAYLELAEGGPAQGELKRARELGIPTADLRHLFAHAYILQGDVAAASAALDGAPLRHAAYAGRIRARILAAQGKRGEALSSLEKVVRLHPDDARAWTDLGRLLYSGGEVGTADMAASRAATLAPGDPHALTLKGELVRSRFGLRASLPWFEAALKRDALHYPALIEYSATLGEHGRHRDMLAASRAALIARPGGSQALYLQAVLAARAGNHDLARAVLSHAGADSAAMPGAVLLGGMLDYAAARHQRAIERWRVLLERQPMNLRVRTLLSAALLRSGDAGGALDAIGPVLARADADAYALTLAARAAEVRGDRVRAAALLDRAAMGGQGAAGVFAGSDAPAVLAAAAARSPADPTYAVGLIRGLVHQGQGDAALRAAQALVRAAPGAPAAQTALGDVLAARGRWNAAADAYRRAADLRFDEPALLRLLDALGRTGRDRDAAGALSLYLSQNPNSLAALRLLGRWQLGAGDWDAAIETLEGARARIGSTDAGLLADLARAYAGDGDGTVARRYARAAYALAPMSTGVVAAYAAALEADGDADGARQLAAKLRALLQG